MFQNLITGFSNLFQPLNFALLLLAIALGFFGGAMPGISGLTLIVVLMPVTYGMDPIPVFVLLTAIYCATQFSGSVSAILYRIPGTPESVATTFDGYPMAKSGRTGQALGTAMLSSALGGTIGAIFLFFLTEPLTNVALKFSSPEYFALAVMGLSMVITLASKDLVKGLISALLGLLISSIGLDSITGAARFTLGITQFKLGISTVSLMIGLFGISEVMKNAEKEFKKLSSGDEKVKVKIFEKENLKRILPTVGIGALIGTVVGILPGVGGTTASIVSYSQNMRMSKRRDEFGTGIPEGIAAPESANNAAATTSLVPLFSLGIPGSATAAIILGVFILHGLQPGPLMMMNQSGLIYTIFASLFMINIVMIIVCKPFIKAFSITQKVPFSILGPLITIFCLVGTYCERNSIFDVYVMLFFGVVGYFFDKIKFPTSPIILGFVLGPMAEEEFRRALIVSNGSLSIFVTRPISLVLLIVAALTIGLSLYSSIRGKKKQA